METTKTQEPEIKYVPVQYVMDRDDRTRKYFENMKNSKYNHNRVKIENGKMVVDLNYDVGDRHEIYELYIEADNLAKNTHKLAVYLVRMLNRDAAKQKTNAKKSSHRHLTRNEVTSARLKNEGVNALYLYLRYGSFKHYDRAAYVKAILRRFIEENSLFGVQS
ncbi:hypothetical protein [Sulfuricurvum sp.]|uniref:hypothetical protein n=1 Tax=Sulfuricurvum sp. TaxID=2025608 RepID=UPI0026331EDF|nr:hypothetical protein [Sulfuricurvum sp.]MDD2267629.1 hypothetical protein [Sulfuricurvum sp.]MDD2784236.1 hypothetical protein [Sulfuricurvum sp.]